MEGKTEKTPGKGPECSSTEPPSQGVSLNVLLVSKVGAIPMPMCSCDKSSCCSIGKWTSLYSSKFTLATILSSLWSSSMIDRQQ